MIKVSVFMMTYNHDRYIEQAIKSALNQQTDFDYEILIGEDFSTDNTREIVKVYADKYPDKIKAFLYEKNMGGHNNADTLIRAAQGEYLAWLEGDDYWTDPCKLQKQVDILDKNQALAISCHNVFFVDEEGMKVGQAFDAHHPNTITEINTLLLGNYIYTPSCVFRNHLVDLTPPWIHQLAMGDWPRHLLLARHGKIHYMQDRMAAYRHTSTGAWHARGKIYQTIKTIEALKVINQHMDHAYDQLIRVAIIIYLQVLIKEKKHLYPTLLPRIKCIIPLAFQQVQVASRLKLSTFRRYLSIKDIVKAWSFLS